MSAVPSCPFCQQPAEPDDVECSLCGRELPRDIRTLRKPTARIVQPEPEPEPAPEPEPLEPEGLDERPAPPALEDWEVPGDPPPVMTPSPQRDRRPAQPSPQPVYYPPDPRRPPRRRGLLPLLGAAAVLVLLVGAVLLFTGRLPVGWAGGKTAVATPPTTPPGPPAPAASTPAPRVTVTVSPQASTTRAAVVPAAPDRDVTREASITVPATARPAVDAAGQTVTYVASHLVDRKPATAWRMDGDGSGSSLSFTFPQPVTFSQVGLINGYAKVDPKDGTDRYSQMRRILRVTWTFDGGSPIVQNLSDGYPAPQSFPVQGVTAQSVTLTIDSTTAPGQVGFDWTPISEVYLRGR